MSEQELPKIKVNELKSFSLYTSAPGVQNVTSKLAFCIRDGYPRVTVYTNIPSDQANNYGIISANMNPEVFYIFLNTLEKAATGPVDTKYSLECSGMFRNTDGTPPEKRVLSHLIFGKDSEGVTWISVISTDDSRPKLKFEFAVSNFHRILKGDGTSFTASEISSVQAVATATALKLIYANLVNDYRVAKPKTGNTNSYNRTPSPAKPANFEQLEDLSF
jgi:hypothetical protein